MIITNYKTQLETPRNYKYEQEWKLGEFFSHMFVMTRKFNELFASTLNGITASVRYVSFIIVVLNAELPD